MPSYTDDVTDGYDVIITTAQLCTKLYYFNHLLLNLFGLTRNFQKFHHEVTKYYDVNMTSL